VCHPLQVALRQSITPSESDAHDPKRIIFSSERENPACLEFAADSAGQIIRFTGHLKNVTWVSAQLGASGRLFVPDPQDPPFAAAVVGSVSKPDTPFTNDPPTLADIELLRAKFNEMLLAQRR